MKAPLVRPAPAMYRINVTPIIDVALVLVIILLVTAPLMSVADMDVTLPGARTRDVREADKVLVTVDAQGAVAIFEERVEAVDFRVALGQQLLEQPVLQPGPVDEEALEEPVLQAHAAHETQAGSAAPAVQPQGHEGT